MFETVRLALGFEDCGKLGAPALERGVMYYQTLFPVQRGRRSTLIAACITVQSCMCSVMLLHALLMCSRAPLVQKGALRMEPSIWKLSKRYPFVRGERERESRRGVWHLPHLVVCRWGRAGNQKMYAAS